MIKSQREVTFIQYVRPDGHRRELKIDRPVQMAELAEFCIAKGACFTAEVLIPLGQISLACEYDGEDIAIELCDNGPDISKAVDKLITDSAEIIKS
jgi:hypothetical protein